MSQIDKTVAQYKDFQQLQEFAQAQQTTIIQLSKKIQRLEDERDHLKTLLESSVPLIKPEGNQVQQFAEDDSEFICTMEIGKLKKRSLETELTYEETRKLSEYFKILTQINSRTKHNEKEVKDLDTKDLLKLVEPDANGSK